MEGLVMLRQLIGQLQEFVEVYGSQPQPHYHHLQLPLLNHSHHRNRRFFFFSLSLLGIQKSSSLPPIFSSFTSCLGVRTILLLCCALAFSNCKFSWLSLNFLAELPFGILNLGLIVFEECLVCYCGSWVVTFVGFLLFQYVPFYS